MKLRKNDVYTVEIEDITNLGFGVARIEGSVVFISGAVTGDVVECKIIKEGKSYSVGRIEKIINRSPEYCCNRCGISACHSCAYKNISYEKELAIKTENVRREFKKAGLSEIEILPAVPSPEAYAYRNKAQYPVARGKNGTVIGFYAPKSHRVTEAASCPLSSKIFERILEAIKAFADKHGISAYDEISGGGLLRHIYLRRAEIGEETLVTIVINGDALPHSAELVRILTKAFPEIVGILLNKNKKNTNVILSDEYETLYGRDYIYDTLAGVRLRISAASFYQVNHGTAELLYAAVKELANPKKDDTILDLYCGAGSIGLSLAKGAGEIIGIEIVEDAVKCAKQNAIDNGITNARFFAGDAAGTEGLLGKAEAELGRKIEPTSVILDPPRAGCDERLLRYVAGLNPEKIIYVSCNPATLARDVAILHTLGYKCTTVKPYDMFPMTGHVETIVCLYKQ